MKGIEDGPGHGVGRTYLIYHTPVLKGSNNVPFPSSIDRLYPHPIF